MLHFISYKTAFTIDKRKAFINVLIPAFVVISYNFYEYKIEIPFH